jgi:EAL domain-containing protein (putative c-di-GMP-specific phosphodiesterase class I)
MTSRQIRPNRKSVRQGEDRPELHPRHDRQSAGAGHHPLVIGLGRGLGMPVVAEGVETEEQLGALRAEGCDQIQGYWISRPGPIANFESVVMERGTQSGVERKQAG